MPPDTRTATVEALEATPLLGTGLAHAETLRAALTRRLTSDPDPSLLLRAQLCFGALLLTRGAHDAATFLQELARQADDRYAPVLAARARLLAVRALCRSGDLPGATALLARCEPVIAEHRGLHLDSLLARAWTGPIDAVALLREALDLLPPARDHDRLEALLELADRCEQGGDPYSAREALQRACALARHHQAPQQASRAALLLGSLLLRTGEQVAAEQSLREALELATEADDSLGRASAGLLLVALQHSAGAWEPLLATSDPLREVARARHNPALLVSLALDRAAAHWALDRPVDSLIELMRCSLELTAHPLPTELLRARFAELLDAVGAERFEALVTAAAARIRDQEAAPPG